MPHIRHKTIVSISVGVFLVVAIFILGVSSAAALTDNCFTDVTTGMWFHDYVCWLFDAGLTAGYPDGTYRPSNNITRAEIAVMMQQLSGEGAVGPVVDADNLDGLDSVDFSNASHDHFGQTWSGTATYGLRVDNDSTGLYGRTTSGTGVLGYSTAASGTAYGVRGVSSSTTGRGVAGIASSASGTTYGVYGESGSPDGNGVRGYNDASSGNSPGVYGSSPVSPDGQGVYGIGAYGVYGETYNPDGYAVYGEAMSSFGTSYGVYGESNSSLGYGGFFRNSDTDGVALYATGRGSGSTKASLRVHNSDGTGGVAAYFTSLSSNATAKFRNSGSGAVLYLENGGTGGAGTGGGDFINAVNESEDDVQFRVTSAGNVYADGGYHCGQDISNATRPSIPPGFVVTALSESSIDPCLQDNAPADFAEMLPATGSLEPGDVLAIGPDGYLSQSSEPYQLTIVGVHSYNPSYLGNAQFVDEEGYVPLALLGIVPVKASSENGAIQPGDMLVASSTPGHAMRAGADPPQGTVIGKALEPLAEGTGFIQMIVTLQ